MKFVWAKRTDSGFTIVELLIVVVVIAILAAITIVAYNGISQRAAQSAAASIASQVNKELRVYAVTNNDTLPATLAEAGISPGDNEEYSYIVDNSANPTEYCVSVVQDNNLAAAMAYTSVDGALYSGECVRNLVIDPHATRTDSVRNMGSVTAANTISVDTSVTYSGASSIRRTATSDGLLAAAAAINTSQHPLDTSDYMSWSFRFRSSVAGTAPHYAEGSYVSTGGYWGNGNPSVTFGANTWQRVAGRSQAPAPITPNKAGLYGISVSNGDSIWIDEYMATATEHQYAFAAGDFPGWTWEGTPNNSTSFGPALRAP